MGYDFVRYLGESLGKRVHSKLIYLFMAYQVIVSVLVFFFDSGFPQWPVIAGWSLFLVLLAAQVLRRHQTDQQEKKKYWQQELLRLQQISRLKERLKTEPGLQTQCQDCENAGTGDDPCRMHAGPSEREFRFRSDDPRYFCLLWSPGSISKS